MLFAGLASDFTSLITLLHANRLRSIFGEGTVDCLAVVHGIDLCAKEGNLA